MQPVKLLKDTLTTEPKTVKQICEESGLSQPQATGLLLTLHARSITTGQNWLKRVKTERAAGKGPRQVWAYHI
jgi:hypothetical protein